jgi:hypothetical protein
MGRERIFGSSPVLGVVGCLMSSKEYFITKARKDESPKFRNYEKNSHLLFILSYFRD